MPLLYLAPDPAPNPRRVRIFLAEKSIEVPTKSLSIVAGEHKSAEFVERYPPGQVPVLELDDGRMIGESLSICRYFEALHPDPPLFGSDPVTVAEIDMWVRRVEWTLMTAVGQVWMHVHPFTARVVVPQYKDFGESNRPKAQAAMRRFDTAIQDRPFLAGESYSVADIILLTTLDFAQFVGIERPKGLAALESWYDRVSARPSAKA